MFGSPLSRREFLTRTSLIALAPTIPGFLSRTVRAAEANAGRRILVVIQLNGGNDGINTVVPFADDGYAKHRDKLRIPTDQVIKLNDHVGLHPALRPAADLLDDGRLAIVQGVGYPNPNRSHEGSMAIWHTARFDPAEHKSFGWIGRAMDEGPQPSSGAPHMMLLGNDNPPLAIRGRRSTSVALAHLRDLQLIGPAERPSEISGRRLTADDTDSPTDDVAAFVRRSTLDAYATADMLERLTKRESGTPSYPSTELAERLRTIAQLIKADFGTPVYYSVHNGYDTHSAQLPTHERLLGDLARALKSFLDDLKAARVDDRVLVLCFSEFGRRVAENASLGTDHGTAGPVFLAGPRVRPGLIGAAPVLSDLDEGDLKPGIDFRRIYASILEDWLGSGSKTPLGGSFNSLELVTTS